MTEPLNIDSPAAAFARQAAMEALVESTLAWAMRGFLDDVEMLARRDGTFMNAGDVSYSWLTRMSYEALATRLPDDVAAYLADVQTQAATPGEAYTTAMAVLTASNERAWSAELTSDVLSTALSMDTPPVVLTAAAPDPTSRRGKAVREAFDLALNSQGISWADAAKRDARTAVTGLDGLRATNAMRQQEVPYKQWVARHDERTRPTHVAADGQRVPLDQPFNVGGAALMHPGDRSGPVGETINCRCVTIGADQPAAGTTALPFIAP
jgi:hypothetical protein